MPVNTRPWNTYTNTRRQPNHKKRSNTSASTFTRERSEDDRLLTGTTVVSQYPTSQTNPVVRPYAINANKDAGVKLTLLTYLTPQEEPIPAIQLLCVSSTPPQRAMAGW